MSSSSNIQFFSLQGLSCAGCVRSVDKVLLGLQTEHPELESYSINFADRTAIISGELSSAVFIKTIQNAGYDASLLESETDREQLEAIENKHAQQTLLKSILALAAGVLMMIWQMSGYASALTTQLGLYEGVLFAMVSALIMAGCAAKIYKGAWQNLKVLSFNMDTLIAIGTLSAWIYSIILLLAMSLDSQSVPASAQHLYFEASVMILGFILLGQVLEAKVRGSTSKAIQSLLKLKPDSAWRKNKEGEFVSISAALLVPGDIVLVKPGESVPCDGVVIEGNSYIDESMVSGEPIAVVKVIDDRLIGSTINQNGSLTFKVSHVGSNTVLSKIIAQVRQAQNSKPAIGKLADQIAAVFVPVVLAIALVTALLWIYFAPDGNWSYVLTATMSVLIIACPCALGLATPMSTMVGVGLAAKKGVLIQQGDALQVAQNLTTVVLDKTGTITQGKPKVNDIKWLESDVDKQQVLYWLQLIEQKSEHPLAHAIVNYTQAQLAKTIEHLKLEDFTNTVNAGVSVNIDGVLVRVGSLNWLGNKLPTQAQKEADVWMSAAKSVVLVEVAGKVVMMLGISDTIKTDSLQAIQQLQKQGLKVAILSGDKQQSVAALATQLGIENFQGELTPEQKLQHITQMQSEGEIVAMLGDGVNDAPALAIADLGCAMGTGTDIAINSADITLIRGSLMSLLDAIKISKLTLSNIKQNLAAAFIYNIIAIPVAAGVLFPFFGILLNPMFAGAAMALSSISVVCNAHRLSLKLNTI